MGRFVILHHRLSMSPNEDDRRAADQHQPASESAGKECRQSHWDLMLQWYEGEHSLRTWALEQTPHNGSPVIARELPAHRRRYLDYEGPVSGDRGWVERWDQGEFEIARNEQHAVEVSVQGSRLQGTLLLEHLRDDYWRATFSSRVDD